MLDPENRSLLLDSLRPPPGYALDHAVGTTFSLNLTAMLLAPMAFTMFALENEDGEPKPDPFALLEAVRSYADRLAIFCQAGQMSVPAHDQLLYSRLEDCVIEVTAPRGGVFHPKVWALRFSSEQDRSVRYRVLVMSRNMTFDRSWDTMLTLEGDLTTRRNAIARNHPLGDFFEALPDMALREELPDRVRGFVEQTQYDLRRVAFEEPDQFVLEHFWPLGLYEETPNQDPFTGRIQRMLVVSPFLSAGFVNDKVEADRGDVLVSRPEAMDALDPKTRSRFSEFKVLDDAALEGQEPEETREVGPAVELSGLHAKLYLADDGWDSRMWIGSANATVAAFERNVEFLVELRGKKRTKVERALEPSPDHGVVALGDLLVDYEPSDQPGDAAAEQLEKLAAELRIEMAQLGLVAEVGQEPGATYGVKLVRRREPEFDQSQIIELTGWPITQPEASAHRPIDLSQDVVGRFAALDTASLTRFFAFKLSVEQDGTPHESRFVLNLPMVGEPADRHETILRSLLRNNGGALRYLLFLLADDEAQAATLLAGLKATGGRNGNGANFFSHPDLFELLVRTLDRAPQRLDSIARLIDEVHSADASDDDALPAGFDQIWQPIWAAHQRDRERR